MTKIILSCAFWVFCSNIALAQKPEVSTAIVSGIIVGGFVDNGAFINFTGPNIKLQKGSSEFMISMLPSLRFKEDNEITKNSFITPSLGLGCTYTFKSMVIQVPVYYNSKTVTASGQWNIGIGIGLKLNQLLKNNKTSK